MALKLKYKIKRIFLGESGIVEKVEDFPKARYERSDNNHFKDDFGNLPQFVTFKNPLGEILAELAYIEEKVYTDNPKTTKIKSRFKYRTYKEEDNFP